MYTARCSICRQQMPTLKLLISHYLTSHSKLKIIKQLLKYSILRSTPNLFKHIHKNKMRKVFKKTRSVIKVHPKYSHTETLYLNENIHILCSQNEIIIGDNKSNVDMEFSFDENSSESKENCYVPLKDGNGNIIPKKKIKLNKSNIKSKANFNSRNSPSASSEDSNENPQVVKRKIKRKKDVLTKTRHYRINITKLKDQQTLDEKSGEFYMCHCREKYNKDRAVLQRSDLRIITSDTESCSDNSKSVSIPTVETKIFCNKCGSGYNTYNDLVNHMQVHETFCRLCKEYFPNEYVFKEHMRLHIFKVYMCHVCGREFSFRELLQVHFECHMEDRTFETVLDMEEDYRIHSVQCSLVMQEVEASTMSL